LVKSAFFCTARALSAANLRSTVPQDSRIDYPNTNWCYALGADRYGLWGMDQSNSATPWSEQ
jgi:hypothetical protein